MKKMKITAAVVGVIILAGTGWFYKRADGKEAPIYRTATIQRGSVKPTVSATGTLSAVKTIQVGTQVSGQVAAIYADFNQHVRKGQLLAAIDSAVSNPRTKPAFQLRVNRRRVAGINGDHLHHCTILLVQ